MLRFVAVPMTPILADLRGGGAAFKKTAKKLGSPPIVARYASQLACNSAEIDSQCLLRYFSIRACHIGVMNLTLTLTLIDVGDLLNLGIDIYTKALLNYH
jgi:hypothetical protein